MKDLKRIAAAVMALCIALTMSACGKEVENKKSDAPTNTAPASDGFKAGEGIINSNFGTLKEFSAQTLTGETVTQEIFADHDLTMIYIWKTDNDNCKAQLSAMVKLYDMLPEGTAFVGMCADGDTNAEEAKNMVSELELPFDSIIGGATLEGVNAFPTAMYIDRNGNVVGEPKEGRSYAEGEDEIAQEYLLDLNAHLGMARSAYAAGK